MEIRMLEQQDLMSALHLVWDVFAEDVAPSYSQEGVAVFQEFIKYENINRMYQTGEILIWGAYESEELCGVTAIQRTGHICLFFVKKNRQGKGIGRMLYQRVYNYCAQELHLSRLTINAAPGSVSKYQHFGMRQVSGEQCVRGMCFVPMEAFVVMGMTQTACPRKSPALAIAIAAGVVFIVAILTGIYFLVNWVMKSTEEYILDVPGGYYSEPWGDDFFDGYDDYDNYNEYGGSDSQDAAPEGSGLDAVDAYTAPNLPYTLKDEVYKHQDEKKQSTLIAFQVKYPQLSGNAGSDYGKVNEAIKKCAMATVDEIYISPDEKVKETVLGADTPALVSYVDYKVCYATEDFISIAFQDEHAKGDYNLYDGDLRTINIGLKDGKVYEVGDIVELSDRFVEEWLKEMRDEAENRAFLSELDKEEMKKTLAGDTMNGIYTANFFVSDDGIEIGYDLNYPKGDANDHGYIWVTAPFDFEEIRPYASASDFWSLLKR